MRQEQNYVQLLILYRDEGIHAANWQLEDQSKTAGSTFNGLTICNKMILGRQNSSQTIGFYFYCVDIVFANFRGSKRFQISLTEGRPESVFSETINSFSADLIAAGYKKLENILEI